MTEPPRLVVAALVLIPAGEAILLVKQSYGKHYWSLPGGAMEPGESLEHAAVREVREETGLDVRLKRVVGLYSTPSVGTLAVTFEGEVVGGTLTRATNETSDCRYFPVDRLPEPVREHLRQRIDDFRQGVPHAIVRTQ